MKRWSKLLWWLGGLILLAGCGASVEPSDFADTANRVEVPMVVTETQTAAGVATIPAAEPPAPTTADQSNETETAAAVAPSPTPNMEPPPPRTAGPEMVWLPYGSGNYGQVVLTERNGALAYAPPPVALEVFFDYDGGDGLLLFGSRFWAAADNGMDSVTDLVVYDYATESAIGWATEGVGRAAVSPAEDDGRIALAQHNGETFDLVVRARPDDEGRLVVADVAPHFSWAPHGRALAMQKGFGLVVADLVADSVRELDVTLDSVYGWSGDRPVWDVDRNLLIYPARPFVFVPLNGDPAFAPLRLDDTLLTDETRPHHMLWSPELRQLVVQVEGMRSDVQVYLLSEDLRYVTDTYFIENHTLVDWYTADESVTVLDGFGNPQVWSLTNYAFE